MYNISLLLYGLLAICVLDITSTPIVSKHLPDRLVPPPLKQSSEPYSAPTIQPSFMQRIAKWFGYGATINEQPVQSVQIQERYSENILTETPQPQQLLPQAQPPKPVCNPCNKVPWIPIVSLNRQMPVATESFLGYPAQVLPPQPQLQYPRSSHQQQTVQTNQENKSLQDLHHPPPQHIVQQKPIQQHALPHGQESYPLLSQQLQLPHVLQHKQYSHQQSTYNPYQSQYVHQGMMPQHQQAKVYNYQAHSLYQKNNNFNQLQQHHILLPTYSSYYVRSTMAPGYNNGTSSQYQPIHKMLPLQQNSHRLVPIPVPNLSVTPIPPLYEAKPFLIVEPYMHSYHPDINRYQDGNQLPQTNFDSVSSSDLVPPYVSSKSQESATHSDQNNNNIEIIKSISLGDFTTTIEYPLNVVQSPIIDLTMEPKHYYAAKSYPHPDYLSEPIVVSNSANVPVDSFSSASSHNFTAQESDESFDIVTPHNVETSVRLEWTTTTDKPQNVISESSSKRYNVASTDRPTPVRVTENLNNFKRNRDTPKDLLDSPIYYLKKSTTSKLTTKNHNELKLTNPLQNEHSSWSPSTSVNFPLNTSPIPSPTTVSPSFSQTSIHHTFTSSVPSEKKPKQIQIIIPYTTKNHPSPFKPNKMQSFDSKSGWSNHNDFADLQESQIVTATVTQPPPKRTTKYLTKILASNLRELLKKEKNGNFTPVDISKLQKNIDVWTEQEFSMMSNKASTISLRSQSKNIPSEYLTTTPSIVQPSSVTESLITTIVDDQFYADEEYSKYEMPAEKFIDVNSVQETTRRLTTKRPSSFAKVTTPPRPNELWNKLNFDISPITKEKVYVVTPQPWQEEMPVLGDFKSPRFLVRPTPGIASTPPDEMTLLTKSINRLQQKNAGVSSKSGTSRTTKSNFRPSTRLTSLENHSKGIMVVTPPSFLAHSTSDPKP